MPPRTRNLTSVPPEPPAPSLPLGSHDVDLQCPECAAVLRTPITLSAVLSVTTDGGLLKVRLINNKALEHTCGGGADGKGTAAMFDDAGQAAVPSADADPFGGDPFGGKS